MQTIGAYEARTSFSKLLERVNKGEKISIIKHGVTVAVLQPPANKEILNKRRNSFQPVKSSV
jgi:prevent-host-death family protein